jgi:hypothetical protein
MSWPSIKALSRTSFIFGLNPSAHPTFPAFAARKVEAHMHSVTFNSYTVSEFSTISIVKVF